MATLEPPKAHLVDTLGDSDRPRASSVGHRHNTRRIRRSSGTYRSPFSPGEHEDPTAVYCVCRQHYDGSRNMIACDRCEDWFHPDCVGIVDLTKITPEAPYFCPNCETGTPARPRSSSSAAILEPAFEEGGRPRSLSQSRKKPKKSPRSLLSISADAGSIAADEALMSGLGGNAPVMPGPPARSSPAPTHSRPIRRAALERYNPHEMSSSLPTYIHHGSSRARAGLDMDAQQAPHHAAGSHHQHHQHQHHHPTEAMTTGRLSRHRTRLLDGQETDDTEFSEMDPGHASPSEHFLRTRTRRRGTPSLPGLERLTLHAESTTRGSGSSATAAAAGNFNSYSDAGMPAREEGDHKRVFHNERERARRSTIRVMFETLRKSVPAVEVFEHSSDRHILEEAARHIYSLTDQGRELEKGVMRLRVENLQLRLATVPPSSPAAAALSAQLSAAVAAYDAFEVNAPHVRSTEPESTEGSSPLSSLSAAGLSPHAAAEDDGVGLSTTANSTGSIPQPEHKDDLMLLLRIAAEEYQAQARA